MQLPSLNDLQAFLTHFQTVALWMDWMKAVWMVTSMPFLPWRPNTEGFMEQLLDAAATFSANSYSTFALAIFPSTRQVPIRPCVPPAHIQRFYTARLAGHGIQRGGDWKGRRCRGGAISKSWGFQVLPVDSTFFSFPSVTRRNRFVLHLSTLSVFKSQATLH